DGGAGVDAAGRRRAGRVRLPGREPAHGRAVSGEEKAGAHARGRPRGDETSDGVLYERGAGRAAVVARGRARRLCAARRARDVFIEGRLQGEKIAMETNKPTASVRNRLFIMMLLEFF